MDSTKRSAVFLGKLPAAFIATAMINFTVGAVLGAVMATNVSLWPTLAPIHAILNPFGWLTLLIYGMTYAVLGLIANIRLPKPGAGWVHWGVAEFGVLLMVLGYIASNTLIHRAGILLEVLAPILFLANILSGVISKRVRVRWEREQGLGSEDVVLPVTRSGSALVDRFFGKPSFAKSTDAIAQRGTELSLMLFVAAGVFIIVHAFTLKGQTFEYLTASTEILVYYGWIAGTVFSVALHLYPRYAGFAVVRGWQAQIGQLLWLVGVLILACTITQPTSLFANLGTRVLGTAFLWFGVSCLRGTSMSFRNVPSHVSVPWRIAWVFCSVLGVYLIAGSDPLSLTAYHTLFLGWITSVVYAVGYTMFPRLIGRQPKSKGFALIQVWCAALGASMMVIAFAAMEHLPSIAVPHALLAVGGILATVAFLLFVLNWLLGTANEES